MKISKQLNNTLKTMKQGLYQMSKTSKHSKKESIKYTNPRIYADIGNNVKIRIF